jgi:transcription elongation GreA/GreB family factor
VPVSNDSTTQSPEKNYITPAGFRRLQREFEALRGPTRREVVKKLSEAAAEGDRSENAEYIYRKRQLRQIDSRIRFLMKRMAAAEVIDPSHHKGDRVTFGCIVTVEDENAPAWSSYQIVGVDESDPKERPHQLSARRLVARLSASRNGRRRSRSGTSGWSEPATLSMVCQPRFSKLVKRVPATMAATIADAMLAAQRALEDNPEPR